MHIAIHRRPGLPRWLSRLLRGPAPTPDQAQRLRTFCKAMAKRDGEVPDWDPLLLEFDDILAMASRRGLVNAGSGWDLSVRLTEAGYRTATLFVQAPE